MHIQARKKICAIIVTFFPDQVRLAQLLGALRGQVDCTVIVDNTPEGGLVSFQQKELRSGKIEVVTLKKNLGIATGFNTGIQQARCQAADYVLLLDQDSIPGPDMVSQLLLASEQLVRSGRNVGAVGPIYFDETMESQSPFQIKKPGHLFYSHALPEGEVTECISLISSGSLIKLSVLDLVGPMRDDLFIDNVDVDWGFRAISKGYGLFGVRGAVMTHRRGEVALPVWVFGWRAINFYQPPRMYYQFRNWVAILRTGYVPLHFKVRSVVYWLGMLYGYLFFAKNKKQYLKYIISGICDGIRGRWGPYA